MHDRGRWDYTAIKNKPEAKPVFSFFVGVMLCQHLIIITLFFFTLFCFAFDWRHFGIPG